MQDNRHMRVWYVRNILVLLDRIWYVVYIARIGRTGPRRELMRYRIQDVEKICGERRVILIGTAFDFDT